MKKFLMLMLLVLSVCACLTACGDDDDDSSSKKKKTKSENSAELTPTDDPAPTDDPDSVTIATTETWGDLTVGVPADWTFTKGDVFDEEDTRYCSVKLSSFKYFDFKMEDADLSQQKYEYNKNTYTNEQEDVSGTYGTIEWTGFQYSDGFGGYGFELYATVNGKPVRVSSCGFKFDSEEAKTVLGSVVVK